jgi:hypothetical protein
MAALRAVGVRSDSGQDTSCSDLVRLSVEVNQSRAHVGTEKVLDKISQGLRCAYDNGRITSKDADEMIEVIAYSYNKGMEATPSPEMCKKPIPCDCNDPLK